MKNNKLFVVSEENYYGCIGIASTLDKAKVLAEKCLEHKIRVYHDNDATIQGYTCTITEEVPNEEWTIVYTNKKLNHVELEILISLTEIDKIYYFNKLKGSCLY